MNTAERDQLSDLLRIGAEVRVVNQERVVLTEALAPGCLQDPEDSSTLWIRTLEGLFAPVRGETDVSIHVNLFGRRGIRINSALEVCDDALVVHSTEDSSVVFRPVRSYRRWQLIMWRRIVDALTDESRAEVTSLQCDAPLVRFAADVDLTMPIAP